VKLTDNTITAYDRFYTLSKQISENKASQSELKTLFTELSKLDYRTEHEKQVDFYIVAFSRMKNIENIETLCVNFAKEHYKYVQMEFWKKYKPLFKANKSGFMINPSIIMRYVKNK
jgi:hypothetical protein